MNPYYPHLLSPLIIRNRILKNRMGMPRAVPTFAAGSDNYYPLDTLITYVGNMAKNGASIVTCPCPNWPNPHSKPFPPEIKAMIPVFDETDKHEHFPIPGEDKGFDLEILNVRIQFARMVEAIHSEGSLASISLMEIEPMGWGINEIPLEYLEEMIEDFVDKCRLYQKLGFDVCNFYMSHGNSLLAQSLSPVMNRRQDKFGGNTMAERARLSHEIFRRVRQACPNLLLEIQVSGEENNPGGYTIQDIAEYAKLSEDLIDILQLRDRDGRSSMSFFTEKGFTPLTLQYAEIVKQSGANVVVAPVGGFQDPALNEQYIAQGKADMIYMAHAFICDSEYGDKVYGGRGHEITPCLQCNKCHSTPGNPNAGCSVNPRLILSLTDPEHAWGDRLPAAKSKHVAVIGGGPAGMTAAIIAAKRGHNVTLYEKSDRLGGQLIHADYAAFKWTLREYKNHLIRSLESCGAAVITGCKVTPEIIANEGFDAVVLAAGAKPKTSSLPGSDNKNVHTPLSVFGNEGRLGRNIAVIGGSEVSVETALYLAQAGHRVTLLTRKKHLATDAQGVHYREYLEQVWLNEPNFTFLLQAETVALTEAGVEYQTPDGQFHLAEADDIVLNIGSSPCQEYILDFAQAATEFYAVGDCQKIADVRRGVKEAFNVAIRL